MRRLALVLWSLQAAAVALTVVVGLQSGEDLAQALLWRFAVFSFAVVGLLILWQQPRNRLGWFLLGVIGTIAVVPSLLEAYVLWGTDVDPGSLPGVALVAGLNQGGWALSVGGIGIFLVLLFPDGRLPAPRWRWLLWTGSAAIALVVVSTALIPGRITEGAGAGLVNPLGLEQSTLLVAILVGVSFALLPVCLVAAATAMVLRFRRSRGTERLQLKWFALATVVAGLVLSFGLLLWDVSPLTRIAMAGALLALPLAICLAILRHRLYDIDVVIKRTVVYGSLTVSLALVYLVVVLTLRSLTGTFTGDSDLAVATSTLVVAALFRPLRRRIQTAVDRRFFRRAYDATLTIESFTERLRQEVSLEAVATDLRQVVEEAMSPTQLSLWLRAPEARR
jgi:hypothetical protein